jgi:hypothetical protein
MAFRQRDTARGWSRRHRALGLARRVFLRPAGVRASLTTALAGTNNDLVWRAIHAGAAGNNIRIRYVVAGASTPLTVTVSGNDITVNVATSGASAATSTAAQVRAAVEAHADAKKMVFADNAAGNDGTGVVAALAFTNLSGGVG